MLQFKSGEKNFVVAAVLGILITQLGVLSVLAEEIPKVSDEGSVLRVDKPSSMGSLADYSGAAVLGDSLVIIDSKYAFYPTYIEGVTTGTINGHGTNLGIYGRFYNIS